MSRSNHRPRRGPRDGRNVLISGDVPGDLGSRQPQGGARPLKEEWRESGDLEAREFGVPQADIPGGVRHLVNPETVPHYPPGVYERPADYHKYHGVESDDGQYYPPPGDVGKPRDTVALPKLRDAVPVYILEGAGGEKRIRALITEGPMAFTAPTVDPFRLADRDPRRVKFWICNESQPAVTTPNVSTPATGSAAAAGNGSALLPAGSQLQSFIISWGSVAVANTVTIAVTNALGGTLNYAVALATGQNNPFTVLYTPPLQPATAASQITVTLTGNANSPTATISAYPVAAATATAAGTGPGVRIGSLEDAADNRGLLVPAGQIKDFNTQAAVYMTNQSGSTVTLSWGYETEVPAAGQGT